MSEKTPQPDEVVKKVKAPPPGLVIPVKKAPLPKAERRAVQEAQRAAKGLSASGASSSPAPDAGLSSSHTGGNPVISSSSVSSQVATHASKAAPKAASTHAVAQISGGSISRKGSTLSGDGGGDNTSKTHSSSISAAAPSTIQPASLIRSSSMIASVLFSHLPAYKGTLSCTIQFVAHESNKKTTRVDE